MRAQGLGGVVGARQFRFAQAGMNFLVADVVQKNGRSAFAALEPRHKVMEALWHIGRDGPAAERANC